jgi:hypothetical protein
MNNGAVLNGFMIGKRVPIVKISASPNIPIDPSVPADMLRDPAAIGNWGCH